MFTAKDISVGDLIADYRLTVTQVKALPAKIWNHQLYSIEGISWDTKEIRIFLVPDNREMEVWE